MTYSKDMLPSTGHIKKNQILSDLPIFQEKELTDSAIDKSYMKVSYQLDRQVRNGEVRCAIDLKITYSIT